MGVFPIEFPLLGIINNILLYSHPFIGIPDNPFIIVTLP